MLAEVEQLLGRRSSEPIRGHSTFDFGRQSRFDVLRIARSDAVNPGHGDGGRRHPEALDAGIRELRQVLLWWD